MTLTCDLFTPKANKVKFPNLACWYYIYYRYQPADLKSIHTRSSGTSSSLGYLSRTSVMDGRDRRIHSCRAAAVFVMALRMAGLSVAGLAYRQSSRRDSTSASLSSCGTSSPLGSSQFPGTKHELTGSDLAKKKRLSNMHWDSATVCPMLCSFAVDRYTFRLSLSQ